jgi:cell wall-associated NlpC family hydrolase
MVVLMPALLAAASWAVIVKPVVNMHARASDDTGVVSQAIYASNVELLEQSNDWARIRTSDDYTGWVPLAAVRRVDKPYASSGRAAQVEALFAHIYAGPSVTRQQPLLTAPYETRLEVVEEQERWIRLRLPDDRAGWIQRGDVTFDPRTLAIDDAILLAKRFLGLPYTWGGRSSFGYDCSGFTQMLCRRRGVEIPRDSKPQAHWSGMQAVDKSALRAGDLIYFGAGADHITHTGMYIGGGEFIHATAHERPVVQISRLDDPHWTENYVCARRLK